MHNHEKKLNRMADNNTDREMIPQSRLKQSIAKLHNNNVFRCPERDGVVVNIIQRTLFKVLNHKNYYNSVSKVGNIHKKP